MREIVAVVTAYDAAKASGTKCVLATVVHVEGSAYRKAGARMLVDEYGMMTGAISGGCLEGDALKKALHALYQDKNKLVTYDTSDEEDAVIGAQLGCNGVIQVLFEPLRFDDPDNPVELLRKVMDRRDRVMMVSFFNLQKDQPQLGTLCMLDEDLNVSGKMPGSEFLSQIKEDAYHAFANQDAFFGKYHNASEIQYAFLDLLLPPPTIVLIGAGNDAQILAQMADLLGWRIVVADGRPTHANSDRFISSCQVVVDKPELIIDRIEIDERTAFVLMSHNYHYDLAVLALLIGKQEIPYIGILGPKKKFQRMLDDIKNGGIELPEAQLQKIHAPVGLNLGAETPSEIALSILAEIQKKFTNSDGLPLRDRSAPIHAKKNGTFKVKTL